MDPVAGMFVDGRKKIGKHGRFKSVMMYSSIALGVLTVVTFLTPNIGHDGNLVYAYLSYAAWGVLYSFTNVPYGSLASVTVSYTHLDVYKRQPPFRCDVLAGVCHQDLVTQFLGGLFDALEETGEERVLQVGQDGSDAPGTAGVQRLRCPVGAVAQGLGCRKDPQPGHFVHLLGAAECA